MVVHFAHAARHSDGNRRRARVIASKVDVNSDEFHANAAHMRALVDELQKRRAEAAAGGPQRARERHI
jgi:3-methylcrotonyl-CoA carboxylase beta subunit